MVTQWFSQIRYALLHLRLNNHYYKLLQNGEDPYKVSNNKCARKRRKVLD